MASPPYSRQRPIHLALQGFEDCPRGEGEFEDHTKHLLHLLGYSGPCVTFRGDC
jgi:hypothetical protein